MAYTGIMVAKPRKTVLPRRKVWHKYTPIIPRRLCFIDSPKVHEVWLAPVMRRYSETYGRYLYAKVGDVEAGTRHFREKGL